MAPGAPVTFRGSVDDPSGVTAVRVNGSPVDITDGSTFSSSLTTHYGINFVDLAVSYGAGREARRSCAFLVADTWAPDDATFSDTLSLRLLQDAFNDGDDDLLSLADVLATALHGAVERELHNELLAQDVLQDSCVLMELGQCVFRFKATYLASKIDEPSTVELTLVDGGLKATLRLQDLRIQARLDGSVGGSSFTGTGWFSYASAKVDAVLDVTLGGGRARVSIRPSSVDASLGTLSSDAPSVPPVVEDIAIQLFDGAMRTKVVDALKHHVPVHFDEVLDGILGGLDVNALGTSFEVPRLDASSDIGVSFEIGVSRVSTSSKRMLFGIGTRFSAPPAHTRPTLGAPSRSGARILDVSDTGTAEVALHEAILTQSLHALWRAGFFDATLDSGTLAGLPAGASTAIATGLPPVAIMRADGRTELSLGALTVRVTHPTLLAKPVTVLLGARASMAVALSGQDLASSDVRVDELSFSTELAPLDSATRGALEELLRILVKHVASSALDGALPAAPIPTFTLPASLSSFGLPGGADLGVVTPALSTEAPHYALRGGLRRSLMSTARLLSGAARPCGRPMLSPSGTPADGGWPA